MTRRRGGALLACALLSGVVLITAATSTAKTSAVPSWCGSKKISLGLTDGFGGNSWRLVTTASARAEAAKCPSVTSLTYADGQGNTQKAISDIQGMVAKGVNALVVFPDAGKAMLPALRSAYKAGVITVPYRVTPGGKAGVDYNVFVDTPFAQAGENWGRWILKVLPKGGNVLMLSGPKGNSQGVDENKGLHKILDASGKYKFIGEQPFEVTNWDPALSQKVLSADIAKYPKIDVIVSDFGPSLVGALGEFKKSGRKIPAMATSDGNVLGCYWKKNVGANPTFKLFTVSTQNDHARLAIDWAVALATGGKKPATTHFPSLVFEDSTTGKPNPVECKASLPGDIYLSAQLGAAAQAKLVKK
jgi:ABC-type sugar transport system substrate-binding protein